MAAVTNKLGLEAIADELEEAGCALTVGLFKNNETPTLSIVIGGSGGQLNEAGFADYARQAASLDDVTWDAGAGAARFQLNQVEFVKGTGGSPETIYGYFVVLTGPVAGDRLLFAELFSPAQTMTNTGDAIKVTPAILFKP